LYEEEGSGFGDSLAGSVDLELTSTNSRPIPLATTTVPTAATSSTTVPSSTLAITAKPTLRPVIITITESSVTKNSTSVALSSTSAWTLSSSSSARTASLSTTEDSDDWMEITTAYSEPTEVAYTSISPTSTSTFSSEGTFTQIDNWDSSANGGGVTESFDMCETYCTK
jgi:hypothetical protein